MPVSTRWSLVVVAGLVLAACGRQSTQLGEGGSVVGGSAGPAGAQDTARELLRCDAPVATLALAENPNGYTVVTGGMLPPTPVPLVRLMARQSGCFRVVDRAAGLRATVQEQELKDAGILRKQGSIVAKGQGYEAQYTLTPSLNFSEQNAGRELGGAAGAGWSNSNEGKVVAAAFLDAHNKLVTQVKLLQAKALPPPVATKGNGRG